MEMLVSHSPPVYSHSPPTGFLADFANRPFDAPKMYRPTTLSPKPLRKQFSLPIKMAQPKRSCLRPPVATPEETVDDIDTAKTQHTKNKKHVVFADDQGFQLTHIKVMSELSCEPPIWSLQFLAQVTQGLISPVPTEQWTIEFRQPASEYLRFRDQIELNNVSLENVIIQETESTVVGTVKVKNISFEKEVLVRSSWDDWKTQVDTFCNFSKIGNSNYTVYDTFSFKLTLPPNSRKLEFCVCFRANSQEYWDNNNGKNYILINRHVPPTNSGSVKLNGLRRNTTPIGVPQKYSMAFGRLATWSELNWNEREDSVTPYW